MTGLRFLEPPRERRSPRFEHGADWVVVGSGAAGAAVAEALSEASDGEVVVVEEGRAWAASEFQLPMIETLAHLYRDFGALPARGRQIVPLLQARAVGGTTVANAAITWRMPEKLHATWVHDHGLGDALPWRELEAAWEHFERVMEVAETPRGLLGGNGALMERGARALGIAGRVIRRNVVDCRGSGRCIQGCPHGAKRSVDRNLLPRACARGAAVLARARVERVERDGGGRAASGVSGRLLGEQGDGGRFRVHARRGVVLAASATGSAPLLLRSGVRHPGLGHGFMAHPGLAVGAVFERDVRMWAGATQSWESGHFWDRRFKLESLGLPAAMVAARLPGFGGELARALDELPRTALWAIQCRARAEGTVRPSPFSRAPWVRYDLGDEDVATFAEAVDVVGRMMFAAGGKELILGIHGMPERVRTEAELARVREVFRDPRQAHFIATHLFGGARMGPDARRHPVDLRFALRGLERCYVVDSSVFPSNLGVNPQHTILATARIAASRML